jgi:hypothetical protein
MKTYKQRPVVVRILIILLLWVLGYAPCFGWGPASHALIAKEGAEAAGKPEQIKHYASLPDYKESQAFSYLQWTAFVSPWFQWSHSAQSLGECDVSFPTPNVPYVPFYPNDGRRPGKVMYELIQNKLDLTDEQRSTLLLTAYGFVAHNEADRIIHFDYAWGVPKAGFGEASYSSRYSSALNSDPSPADIPTRAWVLHHGLKEIWIEYEVLREKVFQTSDYEKLFNTDDESGPRYHMIDLSSSKLNASFPSAQIQFKGNAKLMSLAQKVHRKNRRLLDYAGKNQLPKIESPDDIQGLIDEKRRQMHGFFGQSNWGKWEREVLGYGLHLVRGNVEYWWRSL